ncbi:MAG TPA: TetR/AcrR family transcriptional regulator [Acidimicrobiia bacterium]
MTSRKAEQSDATRSTLLSVARGLFTEHGYATTSTNEIADRAGVTRGALYHHFAAKDDLFRAVFEQLEAEIAGQVARAALAGSDPLEQLRLGCRAFLDACLDPAVQRIVLLEGPGVLGWDTWQEIEERYGYGLVATGVEAAITAGMFEQQPVEPLAHVLFGALAQAGLVVARADDPGAARTQMEAATDRLLDGLRLPST